MKFSLSPLLLMVAFVIVAGTTAGNLTAAEQHGVATQLERQDQARLDKLRELAGAGAWSELATESKALGEHLAKKAHRDPAAFATLSTYRALAHFHLGNAPAATWDWQVALNFAPDVAEETIIDFPEAAERLIQIGLPRFRPPEDPDPSVKRPGSQAMVPHHQLIREDRAAVPWNVCIQMIVGADGVPHSPRVMEAVGLEADRMYSTLEAIRQSRYSPATSAGKPVDYPMTLHLEVGRSS
jgi:hypothetical protein